MALKRRVGRAAAAAVGVAVVIAAGVCYFEVRTQLRGQGDDSLRAEATAVRDTQSLNPAIAGLPVISPNAGGPAQYVQLVVGNRAMHSLPTGVQLPITPATEAVAEGRAGA